MTNENDHSSFPLHRTSGSSASWTVEAVNTGRVRAPVVAWEMVVDDTSSDGNPPCYAYPVTTEGGRTHRGRVR